MVLMVYGFGISWFSKSSGFEMSRLGVGLYKGYRVSGAGDWAFADHRASQVSKLCTLRF